MISMTEGNPTIQLGDPMSWLESLSHASEPRWLTDRRRAAKAHFSEQGLPTSRDEEWRATNIDAIRDTPFRAGELVEVTAEEQDLDRAAIPGLDAARAVFINGRFRPELSDLSGLPAAVTVAPLSTAVSRQSELLESRLGALADPTIDGFTALNTAAFSDGLFVHVPRGVVAERPIHVINLTKNDGGGPIKTHPRNLLIVEESASLKVIEDYLAASDEETYFTNALTEIYVDDNAEMEHYYLERESEKAYNISTLRTRQGRDSRMISHSVLLGGALVRNNVAPTLDGENAFSVLNGLYLGRDRQHLDNAMSVNHAQPHGDSRQYYKGILADRAVGVFSGRIRVEKVAQKTDAKQSNQSLLLSRDAKTSSRPQLEIYADDVKCTHGATIGELDESALFYLQSRGLPRGDARALLVHAFAAECLERMSLASVRELIDRVVIDRISAAVDAPIEA
ncbi:MAG: Fe-S cluster assembly protein SufD [Phycisphaerales bacterium]